MGEGAYKFFAKAVVNKFECTTFGTSRQKMISNISAKLIRILQEEDVMLAWKGWYTLILRQGRMQRLNIYMMRHSHVQKV